MLTDDAAIVASADAGPACIDARKLPAIALGWVRSKELRATMSCLAQRIEPIRDISAGLVEPRVTVNVRR
jgi:hypothetical protein